jgi:hypothetical protein
MTAPMSNGFPGAAAAPTGLWFAWDQVEHAARVIAARWKTDLFRADFDRLVCVSVRGTSYTGPVDYALSLYTLADAQGAAAEIAHALGGQWVHLADECGDWIRVEALWEDAPWPPRPDAVAAPTQVTGC